VSGLEEWFVVDSGSWVCGIAAVYGCTSKVRYGFVTGSGGCVFSRER